MIKLLYSFVEERDFISGHNLHFQEYVLTTDNYRGIFQFLTVIFKGSNK